MFRERNVTNRYRKGGNPYPNNNWRSCVLNTDRTLKFLILPFLPLPGVSCR